MAFWIPAAMIAAGAASKFLGSKGSVKTKTEDRSGTKAALNLLGPETVGQLTQNGTVFNRNLASSRQGLVDAGMGSGPDQLIEQLSRQSAGVVAAKSTPNVASRAIANAFSGSDSGRSKGFSANLQKVNAWQTQKDNMAASMHGQKRTQQQSPMDAVIGGVNDVAEGSMQGAQTDYYNALEKNRLSEQARLLAHEQGKAYIPS